MALTTEQIEKLDTIKQINDRMLERLHEIITKDKAKGRRAKCVERKYHSDNAKGGGLGFLTGLVTKFQKAHKPKNAATLQAAKDYEDAVIQFTGTIKSTKTQVDQIEKLAERFPTFESTVKTLRDNQVLSDNKLRETDSAYKKAKTAELAIYDEFIKYLNSKDAKKEGDAKEYKAWKKQIEETIKELSKE